MSKKNLRIIQIKKYYAHASFPECNLKMNIHGKPYNSTENIDSIDTGLPGAFRYSPSFNNAHASVFITLSGSRAKDYKLAEEKAGIQHVPRVTVWHHVWRIDTNGQYEMQLVDFTLHSKSLPHAGGCKLWSNQTRSKYKCDGTFYIDPKLTGKALYGRRINKAGYIIKGHPSTNYSDFYVDTILDEIQIYSRLTHKQMKYRKARCRILFAWGFDPYGNIFLNDKKGDIYFFDHETNHLLPTGTNLYSFV